MIVRYLHKLEVRVEGLTTWIEKKPYGCVVATGPNNIGVSLVDPEDSFTKKIARKIALGRAATNYVPPVGGRVLTMRGKVYKVDEVNWAINYVREKSIAQLINKEGRLIEVENASSGSEMKKKPVVKIELPPEKIRYGARPRSGCFFDGSPKRERIRNDAARDEIDDGLLEYEENCANSNTAEQQDT